MGIGSPIVRLIRAIDRRGGFTAKRGETAYAAAAPRIVGPLHARIVADAVACLGGTNGAVVVDLGAGPGTLTAELGRRLPAASVVGVEPNRRMLEISRGRSVPANVRFLAGSAEHLPLESGSVDLVVSALSAHHWDDLAAAVAEIRRVLRPGGAARIHDVRFATYTDAELAAVRRRLGLPSNALRRWVPSWQGRVAPFAIIGVSR